MIALNVLMNEQLADSDATEISPVFKIAILCLTIACFFVTARAAEAAHAVLTLIVPPDGVANTGNAIQAGGSAMQDGSVLHIFARADYVLSNSNSAGEVFNDLNFIKTLKID